MKAEFAAFVARGKSHPALSDKIETVVRLNADGTAVRANYVVLYPNIPDLNDARYTALQQPESTRLCRYDVRSVATTADGLLSIVEAVHGQYIGHALTVTGRTCDAIRLLPGVEEGRVQFDRTARLFYVDETYEFVSRRA